MRRFIRSDDRNKHIYICGKTQHGKSTLLTAMAYQEFWHGNGVCVIDAKGDLIPDLIHWVPNFRKDDCILLDLKHPIPIDFMSYHGHDERMSLVSDIIQIFKRMDANWGDRMDAILRNVLHTLLEFPGCTFMDIYKILADPTFRKRLTDDPRITNNPVLSLFWNKQFPELPKDARTPIILTRMSEFLLSPAFQIILGTSNARLNIYDAMNQRKIILVNLEGVSDEAITYGSLLVSKFQQAAFRRAKIPKPKFRSPTEFPLLCILMSSTTSKLQLSRRFSQKPAD